MTTRLTRWLLGLAVIGASAAVPAVGATGPAADAYDLVLSAGRVMDPETGLDAIRNVGITGDRIVRISVARLTGRRMIDAKGLVVAPGFIDLHQHAQDAASGRLKALDGVTTGLEMEIGVPDVAAFLERKRGKSLINYGTTASHAAARSRAFGTPFAEPVLVAPAGSATDLPATAEQLRQIEDRLGAELDAGALGIGMGIQYTPGASHLEVIRMFQLAVARGVPVFTHVRGFGRIEPGSSIEAVSEVIGAAAVTGAAVQIDHINSSCITDVPDCLAMVAGARARGLDVTTEAYPYVAGFTNVNSALFNPGWREKLGLSYDALQMPDTGEKLTKERFEQLHADPRPIEVLIFLNTQERVDFVIANPLVMIASDGEDGHPRNAGTFSRILSYYVRQRGSLTLMDALRKMSLMPAQRLEQSTLAARRKGRLQEGADADVVVFDPNKVSDRATYQAPREASVGMRYVLVNGSVLVDEGRIVDGNFPGRLIEGDARLPSPRP